MKKNMSVVMLFLRSTVYKVLGIFALMIAVQLGAFAIAVNIPALSMEWAVTHSFQKYIFYIAVLGVSLVVGVNFTQIAETYTARKMRVTPNAVYLCQMLVGISYFMLMWVIEIITVNAMGVIYKAMIPSEFVTNQTVFLAFYRNNFLHSVMPYEDIQAWVKNIFTFLVLGMAVARTPRHRIRIAAPQLITPFIMMAFFTRPIGDWMPIISVIVAVIAMGCMLESGLGKEHEYEREI